MRLKGSADVSKSRAGGVIAPCEGSHARGLPVVFRLAVVPLGDPVLFWLGFFLICTAAVVWLAINAPEE
jgi:hypothetical protein